MKKPVVFMGMQGAFSRCVLARLLDEKVPVAAVLIPGDEFASVAEAFRPADPLALPLLNPDVIEGPASLARQAQIPVYTCGPLASPDALSWLSARAPLAVCVACWPRLIPAKALILPELGFLNVHPSLLPAYRGPEPLFWQFQQGETATGVTVHWMDAGMDTGDLAAQESIAFADGISGMEAERLCAETGGRLLARVLMMAGCGHRGAWPQPAGGSYFPSPTRDEFQVARSWPVRRAFNFLRGTGHWGLPYKVIDEIEPLWLTEALAWQPFGEAPMFSEPPPDVRRLDFADGALWARVVAVAG